MDKQETMTVIDARAYIRELVDWEATNGYRTADMVAEWCNHGDVVVDPAGDVWVREGKRGYGHWLREEYLCEFVEWHKATYGGVR